MKLFDYKDFPNPRRVRIFMAEKGLDVPCEQIDVKAGAHKSPEFLKKNPYGVLPVLELDDGSTISETTSICRYLEEASGGPVLMGSTPQEKAVIDMWHKRTEETVLGPALAYFHHATDGLGEAERYRNREWGEKSKETCLAGFEKLETALSENTYLAGDTFSVADIAAMVTVDLAEALNFNVLNRFKALKGWYATVSARPSAAA